MKHVFPLILFAAFSFSISAQTIKIDKMPASVDEFLELRDAIADTPEGGAAIFVIALKMYKDKPEVGKQCLVIAVDRSKLSSGSAYKGFDVMKSYLSRIDRQLSSYPYVVNSYFKGATPENGYVFEFPTQMDFSSNAYSGDKQAGEFKVFVKCYGADSPRPIRLKRNDKGVWKAVEWSSIVMGIRPPVKNISDDL